VLGRYYELEKLTALRDCLLRKALGGSDARSRYVGAALCTISLAPPPDNPAFFVTAPLEYSGDSSRHDGGLVGGGGGSARQVLSEGGVRWLLLRAHESLHVLQHGTRECHAPGATSGSRSPPPSLPPNSASSGAAVHAPAIPVDLGDGCASDACVSAAEIEEQGRSAQVCCSVLRCVAVCCSVLQCVAVHMSRVHVCRRQR